VALTIAELQAMTGLARTVVTRFEVHEATLAALHDRLDREHLGDLHCTAAGIRGVPLVVVDDLPAGLIRAKYSDGSERMLGVSAPFWAGHIGLSAW